MIRSICDFLKKYSNNRKGAAGTEFALVSLPFLLMIFGVMEAGRIVWTMNGVQYAVEETSRYAALNSDLTNEDFQEYAIGKLEEMSISSGSLQVTSSVMTSNGIDFVQVDGSYELSTMLTGFIPGNFGNFGFETSVRKPVIN